MQDIMDATGLEKGGLYRHFGSKQDLAVEAFRYTLGQVVERRTHGLADIPNAVDKLRYMLNAFIETPSPVPGGCPLMNTAVDADDTNPELLALASEGIRAWKSRIVKIICDGIKSGEIKIEVPPAKIANLLVATLEGALLISRLEGNRSALRDVRVSLEDVLNNLEA